MMHRLVWSLPALLALTLGDTAQLTAQVQLASRAPRFVRISPVTRGLVDASRATILKREMSLSLDRSSLASALDEISRTAGIKLIYSRDLVPLETPVTLEAATITLGAALTAVLFDTGLDVVISSNGEMALVKKAPLSPVTRAPTGSVSGRVTDSQTAAPIVGATVVVEGASLSATTDNDGRYQIAEVPVGTYAVRARYIGYVPATASATVSADHEAIVDFALVKSVQKLDELVTVTPGGMQAEVKALPTPVSVITADDIARQRPRNTQQLIRQAVPTAISWDVPPSPTFSPFSVRGASTLNGTSSMKVFVDGIETTNFQFSPVDPNSIDRIEVIRGPQAAAVYGSDALGGVVQIYTRRGDAAPAGPNLQAQADMGILQTPYEGFGSVLRQNYTTSVSGGSSDVSYNFGGGYSRTGSYLPLGEISKLSAASGYGGVRYSHGNFTADVFGRYFANKTPNVFNPLLAETGFFFFTRPNFQPSETTNQTLGARLTLTPRPWWRNALTVGIDRNTVDRIQTRPRLTSPADTLLSLFHNDESKRSISYQSSIQGAVAHGVSGSVGVGFDHYSLPASGFGAFSAVNITGPIDNAGAPPFVSRVIINNTGYFAQGEVGFGDALFLTAGLRAEDNSEFGDSLGTPVSPRVGASFVKPFGVTTLKLRGSYGRGIRAPTPGQKSASVASFQVQLANPLLGPERQQGWDAGVDAVFGARGSLSVTWYDQRATNLIEFVQLSATPVPTVQFQNVGRVKNEGLEVEARLDLGRLQLNAQYGYTRSRIDDLGPNYAGDLRVGDQALQTPRHTAGASLSLAALPTTTLTGGITYVGSWDTYDLIALYSCFGGTGPCRPSQRDYITAYPGFAKVNASIAHSLTPALSAFLSVENIANNQAYEYADTQPVFGRTTTLGLRFNQ